MPKLFTRHKSILKSHYLTCLVRSVFIYEIHTCLSFPGAREGQKWHCSTLELLFPTLIRLWIMIATEWWAECSLFSAILLYFKINTSQTPFFRNVRKYVVYVYDIYRRKDNASIGGDFQGAQEEGAPLVTITDHFG